MNPYINLAKLAVETFVRENKIISPPRSLPNDFFKNKAGVFVTIYKNGQLRGCVGTYLPTQENIAKEIISSAVFAAQDPRFLPITKDELGSLSYEVSILSKPEPIKSLAELDPKKYGVLVKAASSGKSGLLLPDLEGVDTIEKQIAIACQKAGIDPEKEEFSIYKFSTKKIQ